MLLLTLYLKLNEDKCVKFLKRNYGAPLHNNLHHVLVFFLKKSSMYEPHLRLQNLSLKSDICMVG